MNAEEIVRALHKYAKNAQENFEVDTMRDFDSAADLIESLQAKLAESQHRADAAVEDIEKMMRICEKGSCHFCADGDCTESPYCSPKWRGPMAGKGATE